MQVIDADKIIPSLLHLYVICTKSLAELFFVAPETILLNWKTFQFEGLFQFERVSHFLKCFGSAEQQK